MRTSAVSRFDARRCIGIYSVSADTQVQELKVISGRTNGIGTSLVR